MHRQLARLTEEGLSVTWVSGHPREGLADRMLAAIDDRTTVVAMSAVMFEDAAVAPGLDRVMARAVDVGAIPLVDAYHAFNAVPMAWGSAQDSLFVTAGGYKYAGFGNGLCWLRIPEDCELRPVYTGWFSDFANLDKPRSNRISYGPGAARFAGATFDASALYRADAVLDHWDRLGLDVPALRAISLRQTGRILTRLSEVAADLPIVSPQSEALRGAFVTVRHAQAGELVKRLRERNVWVDSRGELLRLGPAPYLTDEEIDRGVDILGETLTTV